MKRFQSYQCLVVRHCPRLTTADAQHAHIIHFVQQVPLMKNTNNRETQFWYDPAQYRQLRQRQAHYNKDVIRSSLKAQGKSWVRPT